MKPHNIELLSRSTRNIIVMGVSGCGKSTVASRLAARLNVIIGASARDKTISPASATIVEWEFADADDFHPPANVEKMRRAEPLNDTDREPWLQNLNQAMVQRDQQNRGMVLACSALKEKYRASLRQGLPNLVFVHLQGSFELIAQRMSARSNHYMPTALLKSQFDTLEVPTDAVSFDIQTPIDEIVDSLIQQFSKT
jgi:gluconokinase